MRIFILLLSFLVFIGCDKPNPEPEKLDPIYSDLEKELQLTDGALKLAEKDLEGFIKEHSVVVPQTGQIKYAEKRIAETNAKINKLKQLQHYWKLKISSRKTWARQKYLEAYNKKESWPPPDEYSEYLAQKKLEEAPRAWNAKARIEQSRLGINFTDQSTKPQEKKEEH